MNEQQAARGGRILTGFCGGVLAAAISIAIAVALTIATAPAAPAFAQDDTPPGDRASAVEEIVVTGSRIRRGNEVASQPINTVAAADIDASGVLTAAEVLNELPQLGNATGAQNQDITSLNRGFNVGTELINLRTLGAQRTLVLVNGRRHVAADPGTSSVDLNSIPTEMIERIEVVTGANSAVYGADAVSGVVNVILRDRYDGTAVELRTGASGEGDAEEYAISALHGGGFAGDHAGYIVSLEYTTNDGFIGADRDWVTGDGSASSFTTTNGSAAAAGGPFTTDVGLFSFDPDNDIVPWDPAAAGPAFRYQRVNDRSFQLPVDRLLLSGKLDYDLAAEHRLFVETTYARTEAEVSYEPQFFWFRPLDSSQFDAPVIPDDNPFLLDFLNAVGAASLNDNLFNLNRFTEYGTRSADIERDLARLAIGFDGQWGGLGYEAYYQYGRVEVEQTDGPAVDRFRFFAALNGCGVGDGTYGLAGVDYDALGCTPVNVFGQNTLSQNFIDYSLIPGVTSTVEAEQHIVSGFLTGDLAELPAGPLAFVVGGEFRDESTEADVHPSLQDRSNAIRQISVVEGDADVKELFGELSLPLLEDRFELRGAARFSDYSTIGEELTWGLSADFVVNESLRLRATLGEATRAPNINELFASVIDSTVTLNDPCANDFDNDGAADPGVSPPAGCTTELGAGYVLSEDAATGSVVRNRTGGNTELDSETADTVTFGVVVTPTAVENLSFSVDYYNIELEDVIGSLSTVTVVDQCYNRPGLPETFCGLVTRNPSGLLESVNTQLFNIAEETVEGIDVQASYAWEALAGTWQAGLNFAHLLERTRTEFDGAPENDFTGRIDAIDNAGNLSLGYIRNDWYVTWTGRFLGSAEAGTSDANRADPGNDIDSILYQDLQGSFVFNDLFSVTAGIKNLTDEGPPLVTEFSNSGLVPSGGITAGGIYDTRGRFFYATATLKFE